jgi:hypothetical protein
MRQHIRVKNFECKLLNHLLDEKNKPIQESELSLGGRLAMRMWAKTGYICRYMTFGKIIYTVQPDRKLSGLEF